MRSMDLPRRSLSQLSDQRLQGPAPDRFDVPVPRQPENGRVWPPVERDGRARSPEELFDNLRQSLSDLAARHGFVPRDRDPRMQWDAPPDYDAYLDPDIHRAGEAQRDRDVPYDRDPPCDRDSPCDRYPPYENGVGYGDAPDFDGSGNDGADRGRGFWDAIRAPGELNDAFAGLAAIGPSGEMGLFADHGYEEPYRPWFMSGDPLAPWWAADGVL
jgi:hypothetical protein